MLLPRNYEMRVKQQDNRFLLLKPEQISQVASTAGKRTEI
jgi:hypothetical protein